MVIKHTHPYGKIEDRFVRDPATDNVVCSVCKTPRLPSLVRECAKCGKQVCMIGTCSYQHDLARHGLKNLAGR